MFKIQLDPDEIVRMVSLGGRMMPVTNDSEVLVRYKHMTDIVAIPLENYAIDSEPVDEVIDGQTFRVKYFHTGDIRTDAIMCMLSLCLPDFAAKFPSEKTELVRRIHQTLMDVDPNVLKILTKSDKEVFLRNMTSIYANAGEEPVFHLPGVKSKVVRDLIADIFVGPSRSSCQVLLTVLSLDELAVVVDNALTFEDVVTKVVGEVRSKLADASACSGENAMRLVPGIELFVRAVLNKSVEYDDDYAIQVIATRMGCPVVIVDGEDRVRIGPSAGDARVLFRSVEDAVGIVGIDTENGFKAILESRLNL